VKGGKTVMPEKVRNAVALAGVAVLMLAVGSAAYVPAALAGDDKAAPSEQPVQSEVSLRAQLGIIYAQNGMHDEAKQEFMKLLEVPQGRSAALTNLGNLSFLNGEVQVALESYQQAAALDSQDPGILLNQGLALKMLGETEEAEKIFTAAVEMAGGVDKAAYLLGLHTADDTGRGKVSKMTADEMRAMLVKADTTSLKSAEKTAKQDKPQVTTRPGGARAAEAVGEMNLYWKDE
jgi:tetratricopeptide (TPR) repeat protein